MLGESFYNDKMEEIKQIAEEKGLLETDEDGVKLIRLDKFGISTPLLLQKKDGASLYATRDLSGILYRKRTWNPEAILYVVGEEQTLYFKQLIKAFLIEDPTEREWSLKDYKRKILKKRKED